VLGGSCVQQCDAGYEGASGICTLCSTGKFKASKGQVCSSCPGARYALPRGNTQSGKCSCPRNNVEISATDMVIVERLGPLLDDSAESVSGLGALLLAANASRPLWLLEIVLRPQRHRHARRRAPELHAQLAHSPRGRARAKRCTKRSRLVPRRRRAGLGSRRAPLRGRRRLPGVRNVFSTSVTACAFCPAGLRCAAHVGAAFGA
jgi:hypothetical protein